MSLIDAVFKLCRDRLIGNGWDLLLAKHGLRIDQSTPDALAEELQRELSRIDRTLPGFEDFSADGKRGIEPGSPARSLLYHAIASPNVVFGADGNRLTLFPDLNEIEVVENYVFGRAAPRINELVDFHAPSELAVVVFAYEYRPASQTSHGRHADLAFSRTGIARVGTKPPRYLAAVRGFLPDADDDPFGIHVLPSRFAAFLAIQVPGDPAAFTPMRFRDKTDKPREIPPKGWAPDNKRMFWVPIHKIFSGSECLLGPDGKNLRLSIKSNGTHINEKIFRLHKALGGKPKDAPPYRISGKAIATLLASPSGSVAVVPTDHKALVEEAILPNGKHVTITVPKTHGSDRNQDFSTLSTSLEYEKSSAPSYAHVRTEIRNDKSIDLNTDPALNSDGALLAKVMNGGYEALNYIDFTGEGWVTIESPELRSIQGINSQPRSAYSLVAAPDLYPSCDQRELTEWTGSTSIPAQLRKEIWSVDPNTLCDVRLSPNLQLPGNPFDVEPTVTAVVSMFGPPPPGLAIASPAAIRHSHLPDDAAGVFSPGWDVSQDVLPNGTGHLAGYALGTPFPEDAKLCAALSTFWPAVAPDATREMEPFEWNSPFPPHRPNGVSQSGTVSPMTDQEIGQIGNLPWDGVPGPRVVTNQGSPFVEYANFHRVDFVRNALAGLFSLRLTARVDAEEYQKRVLAMAIAYRALHFERVGKPLQPDQLRDERVEWKVLSFQMTPRGTPELLQAQQDAKTVLLGDVYRVVVFAKGDVLDTPNPQKKWIALTDQIFLFVDPVNELVLLRKQSETRWRKG